MLMHPVTPRCLFRVVSEAVQKEAFPYHLGLLAGILLSPERAVPCRRGPRLPVQPAAQLRLRRGRSAKASDGETSLQ